MRNLSKNVLGLWLIGMGLAVSAGAQAASAAGPYYATPSWDQTLPAATRFIVLTNMSSQAVLDRETGLVWEQSPSTSGFSWLDASFHCVRLNNGGRKGWRLPTIQDLASLIDPTAVNPALPSGHPFTNVQSSFYWSAATAAGDTADAWFVGFFDGFMGHSNAGTTKFAWCVRGGGPGVDPQ